MTTKAFLWEAVGAAVKHAVRPNLECKVDSLYLHGFLFFFYNSFAYIL